MAENRGVTLRIAFMFSVVVIFGIAIVSCRTLGEPRLVENIGSMSQSSMQQFLDGDFRIVRDMKALPEPVVKAFTEKGGSRLTIANPGESFEGTDVRIWPYESVPYPSAVSVRCCKHDASNVANLLRSGRESRGTACPYFSRQVFSPVGILKSVQ